MAGSLVSRALGIILYLAAALIGGAIAYGLIVSWFLTPIEPGSTKPESFIIERGWGMKKVAQALEDQKLVKHSSAVYFLSKLRRDKVSTIKAGEYALSRGMTPREILEKIVREEIVFHEITIPEGSTLRDIAGLMAATTLLTKDDADGVLHDRALMLKLELPAESFEGYIFPDTYRFSRPDTGEYMVTTFYQEFQKRWTPDMTKRASDLGFTPVQILTLASIIEKETGNAAERKKIASVFHNRLRLGMPLQSDPTVIYGLPNFNGNLTKADLQTRTPYNTYVVQGLPPTPICSPGMDSIQAALYPEDTDYLYFVARGDGTSQFSATYREHQEAVRKFQIDKRQTDLESLLAE